MKKLKFCSLLIAIAFGLTSLTACNKDKEKNDNDTSKDKKEKVDKSAELKKIDKPSDDSFDANFAYMEAHAPEFFKNLSQAMTIVRMELNGQEVSDAQSQKASDLLETPESTQFLESFGVLVGLSIADNITPEQQKRLEEFSEKYPQGMEDLKLLLQLGLAAEGDEDME